MESQACCLARQRQSPNPASPIPYRLPMLPVSTSLARCGEKSRLASPTSWPTMPYADFCPAVRWPFDRLSRRSDAEQISWGKLNRLPCTAAESTLRALDGYGLRDKLPARPALTPCIRFLSIDSHVCSMLPSDPASRR